MGLSIWILISIVSLTLILIGIWPMFTLRAGRKMQMNIAEFKPWLIKQLGNTDRSADLMSGELPPFVFDSVADLIEKKPGLRIRLLTEKKVLAKRRDKHQVNKLVELAFGPLENIELRTLEKLPRNHLKIFDNKLAWVEEPHPYGDLNYRSGHVIKDPPSVSIYEQDFEWYWKRACRQRPAFILPNEIGLRGQNDF